MTSQLVKKSSKVKYILELEHGPILPTAVEFVSFQIFFSCFSNFSQKIIKVLNIFLINLFSLNLKYLRFFNLSKTLSIQIQQIYYNFK